MSQIRPSMRPDRAAAMVTENRHLELRFYFASEQTSLIGRGDFTRQKNREHRTVMLRPLATPHT
jgi:hypothetical protein